MPPFSLTPYFIVLHTKNSGSIVGGDSYFWKMNMDLIFISEPNTKLNLDKMHKMTIHELWSPRAKTLLRYWADMHGLNYWLLICLTPLFFLDNTLNLLWESVAKPSDNLVNNRIVYMNQSLLLALDARGPCKIKVTNWSNIINLLSTQCIKMNFMLVVRSSILIGISVQNVFLGLCQWCLIVWFQSTVIEW